MLKNIHVKNFALIDEVEIDLTDGLNILTGETGAGKSIIIDAVNFALGQKVPKDVVREDTDYALSELVFSADDEETINRLKAHDLESESGEVIFSRKISKGKSSARINGETVTAATLKDIAGALIDIHGQHDNQSLLSKSAHLNLLDSFIEEKIRALKENIAKCYANYKANMEELKSIDETSNDKDKELVFLNYQLDEINAANIKDGEDAQLEALYKKMTGAKKIVESVTGAHMLTGYDLNGAGASVGRALSMIRQIADLDDEANELLLMLTDIDGLINDFNRSVADYESSLDFSDEQFNETESRINVINGLKSKYGDTPAKINERKSEIEKNIARLTDIEAYRNDLKCKTDRLYEELIANCKKLSAIRKEGAGEISKQVLLALNDLNFKDAQFKINVSADEKNLSSVGYDDVEFLICTNQGEKLKPLSMVASGGELSRIMLAIKSVMAKRDNIATLIFDEIDTGISGRTAQKVSEKMAAISADHQVICVTHLPQIAAMADTHFEIKKEPVNGRNVTGVRSLNNDEIINELARMLGGVSVTDAAYQNAKDMKTQADSIKKERK